MKQSKQNNVGTSIARSIIKEKKGITLVALVITIIVLLILAGITISLTIGEDGIIRRAQEAGKNYQEAARNENTQLAEFTNMTDNIIGNVTGGGTKSTIDPSVLVLKAGDYVKYDSGANGVISCRVLYPVTSEYGLQIISDKNVGEDITLGGSDWDTVKTAYNNAILDLNDEAEVYVNPEYAYDGRCVGSLPTILKGMFVDKDKHNGGPGTLLIPDNYTLPSGWTNRDTGCYVTDTNSTTDKTALEKADIMDTGESYWFASRSADACSIDAYFRVGFWNERGFPSSNNLGCLKSSGDSSFYSYASGLRPCISLKSDIIKITGGDGSSEEKAYVIGK